MYVYIDQEAQEGVDQENAAEESGERKDNEQFCQTAQKRQTPPCFTSQTPEIPQQKH